MQLFFFQAFPTKDVGITRIPRKCFIVFEKIIEKQIGDLNSYLELLSLPLNSFHRLLQLQCLETNNWKRLKWTNR